MREADKGTKSLTKNWMNIIAWENQHWSWESKTNYGDSNLRDEMIKDSNTRRNI